MKFAKELEQDLVPEWRAKYFDYKAGKKKVKAVARAFKSVNGTPRTPGRQLPSNLLTDQVRSPIRNHSSLRDEVDSAQFTPDNRASGLTSYGSAKATLRDTTTSSAAFQVGGKNTDGEGIVEEEDYEGHSPVAMPGRASTQGISEDTTVNWDSGGVTNYGSFVASPPKRNPMLGPPALELPDPALPPEEESFARHNRAWRHSRFNPNPNTTPLENRPEARPGAAYQAGKPNPPVSSSHLLPKRHTFQSRRAASTPGVVATPALRPRLMRRLFSSAGLDSPQGDVPLEAYREYDFQQAEYFKFLDKELEKVESFYKMKETQASDRLQLLRDQLHEMRDRRMQEIRAEQLAKEEAMREHARHGSHYNGDHKSQREGIHHGVLSDAFKWIKPIESAIGVGPSKIGKSSKFLQQHTSPAGIQPPYPPGSNHPETWRDFTRRSIHPDDVPYRAAKRKLKLALQEFYRGLELLKSYALLNRTAFRKINKKYDKAINARPTQRYMSEKVNKAWFVQSEVLEGQIVAVEDLYARYFERGNHKVAVGKLRSKGSKVGSYNGSVFRNGLLLATGAVFGTQGVVYGGEHLFNSDYNIRLATSYLLQLYGGYFLGLFLFLLFCVDCKIWNRAKINYPFIFEFDSRHNLDWHQLAELPCLFFCLLGVCVWLNFQQENSNSMFLYWPVVLVGLTLIIMFLPAPILYHRSREWWAYSNFRLLLAGVYPVEFRDFFLGDMYCSQTYSMGNLELFFCLYTRKWNDPEQCNSSNSELLGFFSTVPGIWRALQCLRRYYDTRNAFPHLVNCGKYTFTILFYMTLSLYRIHKGDKLKALFIACATINSVYCSIWDLAMDWSLLNYYAPYPFLRENLGYKYPSMYYAAMILDPILRFNWIFYAIYSDDVQHSALLSFFVSFSEVCRRGMWTLFRVENEHCTNVGRFRASRDVPLPYELEPPSPTSSQEQHPSPPQDPAFLGQASTQASYGTVQPPAAAGTQGVSSGRLEAQPSSSSLRRRAPPNTPISRGIARVGTFITEAHAQDFERKRRHDPVEASPHHGGRSVGVESSDEEDLEEDEEEAVLEQTRETRAAGQEDLNTTMDEQRDEEDIEGARGILRRRRSATRDGP